MSAEAIAAIALAVVTTLALLGGGTVKLLTMHIDTRVRRQVDQAAAEFRLGQQTIALNQEANGRALAALAAKIENGLVSRLKNVEKDVAAITKHLLK